MKNNRHTIAAKGIMVLLSLLVLVFAFSFAWFVDADAPAVASGISVSSKTSTDFQMAIGFSNSDTAGNYYITDFTDSENTKIDFERLHVTKDARLANNTTTYNTELPNATATYNLLSDFKPIDLTGDGITLFRPEMTFKNRSIDFSASTVDKDLVDNRQFISFDLYVRSTSNAFSIKLDTGSYVVAACEVDSTQSDLEVLATEVSNGTKTPAASMVDHSKLTGGSVQRLSKYGSFSEDSVVGAVRVAFAQYNPVDNLGAFFTTNVTPATASSKLDSTTRQLWIPRSDIYLQDTENENNWTLHTSSDSNWANSNVTFYSSDEMNYGRTVTYKAAAEEHRYYDESKINNATHSARFSTVDDAITDIEESDSYIVIQTARLSNDQLVYDGTYYYGKCRINLWIEGCDAEARRAIDGGSFFFGFDLSGA